MNSASSELISQYIRHFHLWRMDGATYDVICEHLQKISSSRRKIVIVEQEVESDSGAVFIS